MNKWLIDRMMDHEIEDGKLRLKENDLVLYENRDEGKNYQSVARLIFMIILVTVVSVILLRKIFGAQRRKLFRFMYICLFLSISLPSDQQIQYRHFYLLFATELCRECARCFHSFFHHWLFCIHMDFDQFDFALFIKDEVEPEDELHVRKVLYQGNLLETTMNCR